MNKYKDKVNTDFLDARAKFRSVYNELRTKEHDTFANLQKERGKDRNEPEGDAYSRIEVEKALIKERLAKAGGRGAVMAFEEDSEEPSEGEEFYENEEDGKEDNEATEVHRPKVGAGGVPPLPGGLPRPPNATKLGAVKPVEPAELSATLDAANRSARGSEFRIKHNTSKGSLGATAGSTAYQNPAKKSTRPSLIGMNKPQML